MSDISMHDINFDEQDIQVAEKGAIIKGKVIKITNKGIYLDIKAKVEARVEPSEFDTYPQIGDELEVLVLKKDEINGEILVSKKEADLIKAWKNVIEIYNNTKYISGKIIKKVANGYEVDVGLPAFLPFSQIKKIDNINEVKDKHLMFKIIKLNPKTRKIVLSRNEYIKEVTEKKREEFFSKYKEYDIVEGIVKNITDFGVFVDIDGIDALIPKSELSWRKYFKIDEIVSINQKIKAQIISIDKEKKQIRLSYKLLQPNPWNQIDKNYQIGMIAKGRVVSIKDYGAVVEFEDGISGFVSLEDLTWAKHIKKPKDILSVGSLVDVKILEIDKINQKIKLGLKQVHKSPLEDENSKYKIGEKFTVTIKRIVGNGAYVEIENDDKIEGFIPVQEVSWTKKYRNGNEAFKKGKKHLCSIIDLDKSRNLVIFSLRALQPNPWIKLKEKMENKQPVDCVVSKIVKNGAFLFIEKEIDGFLPISHFDQKKVENPYDYLKKGQRLKCIIIDIDEKAKRAIVSLKEYNKIKAEEEIAKYVKKEPTEKITLGDILKIQNKGE